MPSGWTRGADADRGHVAEPLYLRSLLSKSFTYWP